jgi:carboxynorspermidine decarboxylase
VKLDLDRVPTPCYLFDKQVLKHNLAILGRVQEETGCKILMAFKGFAMFSVFPVIREYLAGAATSSLDEARLAHEEFGGEVHLYAPAYKEAEFQELMSYADHISFNSFSQWRHFQPMIAGAGKEIKCGIRVNPQHSEVATPVYDPCSRYSRLGVTAEHFDSSALDGITGLHFHTLCELNEDALERTLAFIEERFGAYLSQMDWVNFGGGHLITDSDYDVDKLCRLINDFRERYQVDVYLEPGEAIALNAGVLVASVLDIVENEMQIAILDTSAAAHMPDVLEMPYRPDIEGTGEPDELAHTYRLAGATCLAGDVIGDYSFAEPLAVGSKLAFLDMAHYTMVKNNTFNGIRLPTIAIHDSDGDELTIVREFQYEDFRNRLS